jgi:hypothetical protein
MILLLPTTAEFLTVVTSSAFGQQLITERIDKDTESSLVYSTNEDLTDQDILPVSTPVGANISSLPSSNVTEAIPTIRFVDIINSTYVVSQEDDQAEVDRRVSRAVGDRINDIVHTIVRSNATISSTATITSEYWNGSVTINNNTRFLEVLQDEVRHILQRIRTISPTSSPLLELHTDIQTTCIANTISFANCEINIRLR